jgi:hypothetical protein
VCVQHCHRETGAAGFITHRKQVFMPDAMLGAWSTRVTRIDVAMAKTRVHANRDRPTVTGAFEVSNHARRSNVRE